MAEDVVIVGELEAAAMAQTIEYFGQTFTITNKLSTAYNTATTVATPDDSTQEVKGIFDFRFYPGNNGTDVRLREKAIIIATAKTNGDELDFTPGIGDEVTADSLRDSIRAIDELRGSQGVTSFYRLTLEGA